jgi:Lrp/AsnC family transcriptional regulator, leucine-responsive regulatory protein
MMGGLDSTDKRILAAMLDNSKMQSQHLSRKLRIHPNTLLQRVKRMEASGVLLKYSAVVDFAKVERCMDVMVFVDVNMEKEWEGALRPLSKLPEVVCFLLVSGEHDALVMARVKDEKHLASLVRRIQGTGVVRKTTSNIVVDAFSRQHEYNPFRDEWRFGEE